MDIAILTEQIEGEKKRHKRKRRDKHTEDGTGLSHGQRVERALDQVWLHARDRLRAKTFPTRRESLIYVSLEKDFPKVLWADAHTYSASGIRAAMLHVRAKALADAELRDAGLTAAHIDWHNDGAGSVSFEFTPREPEDACLEFVTRALRNLAPCQTMLELPYELYTDIGLVQALLLKDGGLKTRVHCDRDGTVTLTWDPPGGMLQVPPQEEWSDE